MANIREWTRWAWSDGPIPPSKDSMKTPMSATARLGAALIGAVVGFVGLVLGSGGASVVGGWLLLLGGVFAVVNLALAGWRLMRDG
ncbi:hypothetical protein [Nocardioides montaniterrae]